MTEEKRGRAQEISNLLVHSQMSTTLGAGNSAQVFHVGARDPTTQGIKSYFLESVLAGTWNWEQSWNSKPSALLWFFVGTASDSLTSTPKAGLGFFH